MKKLMYLIVLALILGMVLTGCFLSNVGQVPANEQSGVMNSKSPSSYDDVTLLQGENGNLSEVWDLTQCDLTLSYTIDMSNIDTAGWVVTEVGLREVGAPNIDPPLDTGGFLLSKYYSSASGDTADLNDLHVLMIHGWLEEYYDRQGTFPGIPTSNIATGTYFNHAFWFDRDGVDPDQANYWNYKDGITYNTEGVYNVVIQYHALNCGVGVMYATINGEQQGFYTQGYDSASPPETMPVGRTFTGDMTKMQVFYGRGGGGGYVDISDITVDGCLRTIVINGCDTGVADILYDGELLISEYIKEIYDAAINHGEFVWNVARLTNDLMKDGIITGKEKGKIQSCAAKPPPACALLIEGNTKDISWGFRNTKFDLFPNDMPITFTFAVNAAGLQNNGAVLIGLLDKKYVDEGSSGYMGGAYAYFGRIGNNLRVGPTDGNLGGEIVQVFKTLTDYFISPTDIYLTMLIHANSITIMINSDIITDTYGAIKTLNNTGAYLWDEFENGAYIGIDSWPYDEYGINDMTYNVTIDWCTE
jgi:hypothetical protein